MLVRTRLPTWGRCAAWRASGEGSKGVDLNPKAEGPERREYIERIALQPIDAQANGPQLFYGLRYHVHILATDEQATFHDQVGYWLWEPATGLVLQTVAIPRGQVAIASGQAATDAPRLVLSAERGQTEHGICSTAFLEYAFRTDSYRIEVSFNADGSWSYISDTMLTVRGRPEPFRHRDHNTLVKVAEPTPRSAVPKVQSIMRLDGKSIYQRPPKHQWRCCTNMGGVNSQHRTLFAPIFRLPAKQKNSSCWNYLDRHALNHSAVSPPVRASCGRFCF